MGSFHAYPSAPQHIAPYSRAVPLQADVLEVSTLTKGHYDVVNHCFVADQAVMMQFHANFLFATPPSGSEISAWLYKNVLPPPDGSSTGEAAGDDVVVYQPPGVTYNVSSRVTKILSLQPGDRVWAVPGINGGGNLTGAVSGTYDTVNYFEGVEVN